MIHDPLRLIKYERWARIFASFVLLGGVLLLILSGISIARAIFGSTTQDLSDINTIWIKSITIASYFQAVLASAIALISLLSLSRIIRFLWMLKNLALRRKLSMRKKSR